MGPTLATSLRAMSTSELLLRCASHHALLPVCICISCQNSISTQHDIKTDSRCTGKILDFAINIEKSPCHFCIDSLDSPNGIRWRRLSIVHMKTTSRQRCSCHR